MTNHSRADHSEVDSYVGRQHQYNSEEFDGLMEALRAAVASGFPAAVSAVSSLVRIPSVSWDGFDTAQVQRSAEAVVKLFEDLNFFDQIQILQAKQSNSDSLGQPAVLATRAARNGKPTVMLYAHHDVQPPGDPELWETNPFEPTIREGRLYGRGAADDKAGVVVHLAALRALLEVNPVPELGVVLFIEGEEEFGSKSFRNFMQDNRDSLAADVIVVADSDNWNTENPSLTVSLRGNVTFTLTLRTLEHASHSGMYGGAAPDAMLALVRLLATMHDERGSVAIDGMKSFEGITPEYGEERLREEAAFCDGVDPIGVGSVLSRLWLQPTVTITGVDAPSVVNASNTLLPSVRVKVSARVAPGQSAAEAFEAIQAHIAKHTPFGAQVTLDDVDLGEPFLVDTGGWAVEEVSSAMADGWGIAPVFAGIGGSIPFISDLVAEFPEAQILVTGVEDPDTRAHSPNESLHLGVFKKATLTEAIFLARLNNLGVIR